MPFGKYNIKRNGSGHNNSRMFEWDLKKQNNPLIAVYSAKDMKIQIRTKIMDEINDKISRDIKEYLFFDPNEVIKKNIFKKALAAAIKDAPANYEFIEEITQIYLDDLGDEIAAAAIKSGNTFHEISAAKFKDPEFADLNIDREKLKKYKEYWLEKYNNIFNKLND